MIDDRTDREKQYWACVECKKDTFQDNKDYYMLKDHVWKAIAKDPEDMMCMDCAEKALGHKLTITEIMICPLNTMFNDYTRSILKQANVQVP